MSKVFVLYDGRAKSGDTDDATVLTTAHSEAEAYRVSRDWESYDAVWYEYDMARKGVATNERRRDDIGKGLFL